MSTKTWAKRNTRPLVPGQKMAVHVRDKRLFFNLPEVKYSDQCYFMLCLRLPTQPLAF